MSVAALDKYVYYCLLLYALLSSITIAGTNIAISLAAVGAMIRYYKEPLKLKLDKGLGQAILFFLGAMLLSALFANYSITGLNNTANYLYRMLPLFLVVAFVKNKQQLIQILAVMTLSLAIADIVAIWQGIHGNFRAHALSSNYMVMAGFLLQMMPVLLVMSLEGRFLSAKYRAVYFAVFIMSCAALIYNGTRGAWIAVGIAVPLGLFSMKVNKKIAAGLLIVLISSSFLLMQIPLINERMHSITDMKSAGDRFFLWQSAWQMFLDHPLTGIGTGNFEYLYIGKYMSPFATEELTNAHNNYLHILAENGAVGFVAFLYLFGYILCHAYWKMKHSAQRLWGLTTIVFTVSLLVQGFTQTNFVDSAVIRMYWFLLGLMQAAYHIEESDYV